MSIDPTRFEYTDSRLKDLYKFLKSKGFDVYMPNTKYGDCVSPYIVVKNNGGFTSDNFRTKINLYTVICHVPKQAYSTLEPMVESVRTYMKELKPMFLENGMVTSSYFDENIKAHMSSVEYKNYRLM